MRAFVLILLLTTSRVLAASDPVTDTQAAVAALATAEDMLGKAATADDQQVALNASVMAFEKALQAIRAGERDMVQAETKLRADLDAQRGEVAKLIGILLRMQQLEGGAMLVYPGGALDRVHATLVVEAVTPKLKAGADRVAGLMGDLVILQGALEQAQTSAKAGLVRVRWAREELKRVLKSDTPAPTDLSETLQSVAAASRTLDLLIEGVAALSDDGLPLNLPERDIASRFGKLPMPAAGMLISTFGDDDGQGDTARGATIVTGAGAFVRAPFDATVRYVGPFLGYGNVIILEPSTDILLVLAGLKEVYVGPEEIVSEGTALGVMSGVTSGTWPEDLTQTLYVELRRGGAAVNPEGWFAVNEERSE
ncbi:MAG: peptidoglycan DD-metalloendopeptidase family protein [Deltaproteobacteria bacterium]